MGSMEKGFVHYCCVAKGGRILQAYSGGDDEIEKLAALCLEKAPLCHRWYSQTMSKRTFMFLMEDGYVYFAIANEGIGNPALLQFLEHVRIEFKKIAKKSSGGRKGGASNVNLQEQLVPVIRQLITSLQNVSQTGANGGSANPSSSPCVSYYGEVVEVATSTKAPLLGNSKTLKQDKKVKDHHMIAMRGIELEENRRSTDRGHRGDSDSNPAGATVSPLSLHKDMSSSMRLRSQTTRRKWCRLVRLVLIVDAAVCILLFLAWLLICQGLQCVRH
ncbi:phytolongin Phyl1.1-like [Chenopodium quinoa]|uniref:phytolongin Phyl1.1-like n=1 Tax=Chenopodium quinoa TaxID=63459 RepID=UPI000B791F1D|nr:phytolongin Phyl1.1-like [Chenopodium quinoa]